MSDLLDPIRNTIRDHPRSAVALAAAASLATVSVPWMISNYHDYISLGQGGLPLNVWGWMQSTALKPFGVETLSTTMYDKDRNKESFLKDPDSIPERRGDRPKVGWHFIPHRQLDKIPGPEAQQRLTAIFARHASGNPGLVEMQVSPHERTHKAMMLPSSIKGHKVAEHARREIAHMHPEKDFSLHVVLSPQDCKLVIDRGWGERHPLSSTRGLPKEYLFIYAPRNEEELDVVERILVAAIGYMNDTHNVV